jgi:flotillin
MDVRDAKGSEVIHQIMAKRMSAIDMESRTEVAQNNRQAEEAELEATKKIAVKRSETEKEAGEALAKSTQAIGVANAEATKISGIADQKALSDVAEAAKITAEKNMEVIKVNTVKQAEINKEQEIIDAEKHRAIVEVAANADKFKIETDALAALAAQKNDAEGIKAVGEAEAAVILAKGTSTADALKAKQLASVTAQTTLATEIGENEKYQDYLIRVKEVDKDQIVEVAKATSFGDALGKADLKLLVNSGDVHSGIGSLTDILTSKGGSQMNGMIEAFKQTDEGKSIFGMLAKAKEMGLDVDAPAEEAK